MKRLTLIAVVYLLTSVLLSADELSRSAYELAETQLLAEYVGLPDQQEALGIAYYKGKGVQRDYEEALNWFRKAADQGSASAQYRLGLMYDKGEGASRNQMQAVNWYRKAADQGHVSAQFNLGNKYAVGRGVPQNYAEAYVWYSLAAASSDEKALKQRDIYARKLSHDEIMEAQRRSAELFADMPQTKVKE